MSRDIDTHWRPGEPDFNDQLFEQLRRTPWFMISLVLHLVAFLILSNIEFSSVPVDQRRKVEASLETTVEDELIEQPEEVPEERIEDETIDEVEVSEVEVDEDVERTDAESEDDAVSDQPMEGRQDNSVIGIGGAVGGMFGGRPGGGRNRRPSSGGEGVSRDIVEAALDWLARHQVPDEGYWDADGYQEHCTDSVCAGKGYPAYDAGVTGLALLAFLGAGHTHQAGRYKAHVLNALKFLRRIQDPEGCFGVQSGHFMYAHACCTLAMAEAYGMTQSAILKRPVEKAVAFLARAQNPNPSGTGKLAWRYSVQPGENDTSVTGWVVMALKAAMAAGIDVSPAMFQGAEVWLDQMSDPATGRVGYMQPGVSPVRTTEREAKWPRAKSESITAVGMLSRVFIADALGNRERHAPWLEKGARLCTERLPKWVEGDGSIDHYYWYYGTLAMFQVGGTPWRKWNKAMKRAIIDHQRKDGCERGSWDPLGPWGEDGGRVYSTALLTMCLEVYYRYPRVFGTR